MIFIIYFYLDLIIINILENLLLFVAIMLHIKLSYSKIKLSNSNDRKEIL